MERSEILSWLHETDPQRLEMLWAEADRVRHEKVGDDVWLRGLVEVSSHCRRSCAYCGLRAENRGVKRYRLTREEILDCANKAVAFGFGTLVLQSGEDPGITVEWLRQVILTIKQETDLAVTLSLGERDLAELSAWRNAGADRYLLRFETSNRTLFDHIHPPVLGQERSDRLELLRRIRALGYETGSGVMVGIPGQSYSDLADDIAAFRDLELDMIGVGPYIPHPGTPLGQADWSAETADFPQVPNDNVTACKVIALTRMTCPTVNIPSTTALATLDPVEGRRQGLTRGANIVMPNLTPARYRAAYSIYPEKAGCGEEAEDTHGKIVTQIHALGRSIGRGRGDSLHFRSRG